MRIAQADTSTAEDPDILPYKNLLFAILERAMLDYKGFGELVHSNTVVYPHSYISQYNRSKVMQNAEEAANWINSNQDDAFSFIWILDQLGISHKQFIKMLNALQPNSRTTKYEYNG